MEVWKDITGYEGLYTVINIGKIKSRRNKTIKTMLAKNIKVWLLNIRFLLKQSIGLLTTKHGFNF